MEMSRRVGGRRDKTLARMSVDSKKATGERGVTPSAQRPEVVVVGEDAWCKER